jgi:hypothetical protein
MSVMARRRQKVEKLKAAGDQKSPQLQLDVHEAPKKKVKYGSK